jgi:hypothetical protein
LQGVRVDVAGVEESAGAAGWWRVGIVGFGHVKNSRGTSGRRNDAASPAEAGA